MVVEATEEETEVTEGQEMTMTESIEEREETETETTTGTEMTTEVVMEVKEGEEAAEAVVEETMTDPGLMKVRETETTIGMTIDLREAEREDNMMERKEIGILRTDLEELEEEAQEVAIEEVPDRPEEDSEEAIETNEPQKGRHSSQERI